MEFLAMLYTVLLVAICLMMAVLLFRSGRPTSGLDEADCEELKDWLEEQLAAQAREFNARQDAIAQQNYAAIRSVSETLQTAVQSMSTTLGQGQDSQQRILERRLQSLEQANNQQMEQLRRAMVESMTALQAENTRKLDEIRHTVDEQLQDALQKRVTESFKAVNQQLEQVYKGLGEMQSLAADVGGLKQVLSGVKTRGILGEIQLGAILEEILAPEQYDTNVATIPGSTQRVEYAIRMPGADGGSVWLPIDSKFPGDTYAHLQDAYASGDAQAVEDARHALELVLRSEARDIREKIKRPYMKPSQMLHPIQHFQHTVLLHAVIFKRRAAESQRINLVKYRFIGPHGSLPLSCFRTLILYPSAARRNRFFAQRQAMPLPARPPGR